MRKWITLLILTATVGCKANVEKETTDTGSESIDSGEEIDSGEDAPIGEMPLTGTWTTPDDTIHEIDETIWMRSDGFSFRITVIDQIENHAIAQNHVDNPGYPDLWSRFEWTWGPHQEFYFCHGVLFAISQQAALDEEKNDPNDLESGCRGGEWTPFRAPLEITGLHVDRDEIGLNITPWHWTIEDHTHEITWINPDEKWAVAQIGMENPSNANRWSKIHWQAASDSKAYFCVSAEEASTEEEAASATADSDDLLQGCMGGEWTERRRPLRLFGEYEQRDGNRFSISSWVWENGGDIWEIAYGTADAIYAQNHTDNLRAPEKWSRFNWISVGLQGLFYCHSEIEADTLEGAENSPSPDTSDLAAGCRGGPWVQYRPVLEISELYQDNSGALVDIDSWQWTVDDFVTNITHLRRSENWLVAKNDPNNSTLQTKWSKFKWVDDNDQGLRWCWVINDANSEAEAYLADADEMDLENGCLGGQWGILKRRPPFIGLYQTSDWEEHQFGAFEYVADGIEHTVSGMDRDARRFIASDAITSFPVDWLYSSQCNQLPNADSIEECLFYCKGDGSSTRLEALESTLPDDENLESGCHGEQWIQIRPLPPFIGDFELKNGEIRSLNAWQLTEEEDTYSLSQFNVAEKWLTAYTGTESQNAPDGWHKYNWHIAGQSVFLCRVGYDQSTEHLAMLMPLADPNNLESGCHLGSNINAPWTEWRKALPISGLFEDSAGKNHQISAYKWEIDENLFHVDQSDLSQGIIIAQNDSNNTNAANQWSKIEWVLNPQLGAFYCHSVDNANSSQDAIYFPGADSSDLQSGCLNGPWIPLTPD